jgi:hypothetical protein
MQKWGEPIVFGLLAGLAALCAVYIATFLYR